MLRRSRSRRSGRFLRIAGARNGRRLRRFQLHRIGHQPGFQYFEGGLRIVGVLEQIQVFGRDHAVLHQRVEIDDLLPVLRAVQHDRHLLGQLLGLRQGEHFHHLVHGAEAARETPPAPWPDRRTRTCA